MSSTVQFSKTFEKGLKRLPPDRQKKIIANIGLFIEDSRYPSLDFRPLSGLPGYYIINGKHGDRIILRQENDELYTAVDVGPHDNVYRRISR